ncbi:MAG: hypothetical protein ACT4P1_03180 [Sporichthyaceae bacterium]
MSKWLPLLVRIEDYAEITALIAQRETARGDEGVRHVITTSPEVAGNLAADQEEEKLARRDPWSLEDLATLARGLTLTTARWTRAMDVCTQAREKGEIWLPTSKVAQLAGMEINEWRDAPRKISRHLKANFPNVPRDHHGDHFWPLCPGGGDLPANGGEVWWAITAEMARRWRQVRAGALS